jgi:hypothetical protein
MHVSPAAVVELIDLALTIPATTNAEGLPTVARRWRLSEEAIALADACAAWVATEEGDTLDPALVTSPLDDFTARRVLRYADTLGFGLSTGVLPAARSFVRFLMHEVKVSEAQALDILQTWNSSHATPLTYVALRELFVTTTRRAS